MTYEEKQKIIFYLLSYPKELNKIILKYACDHIPVKDKNKISIFRSEYSKNQERYIKSIDYIDNETKINDELIFSNLLNYKKIYLLDFRIVNNIAKKYILCNLIINNISIYVYTILNDNIYYPERKKYKFLMNPIIIRYSIPEILKELKDDYTKLYYDSQLNN